MASRSRSSASISSWRCLSASNSRSAVWRVSSSSKSASSSSSSAHVPLCSKPLVAAPLLVHFGEPLQPRLGFALGVAVQLGALLFYKRVHADAYPLGVLQDTWRRTPTWPPQPFGLAPSFACRSCACSPRCGGTCSSGRPSRRAWRCARSSRPRTMGSVSGP